MVQVFLPSGSLGWMLVEKYGCAIENVILCVLLVVPKGKTAFFEVTIGKDEVNKLIRYIQFQTFDEAGILFTSLQLMYEKRTEVNKMMFYRSSYGISSLKDLSIFESLKPRLDTKIKRTDINTIKFIQPSIEVCPKEKKKKTVVELFGLPRYKELTNIEAELCTGNRLTPEFFLDAKATMINDCKKNGGILLKKARKLFRKDVNKTRKMYDLLLEQGLIWLPEL